MKKYVLAGAMVLISIAISFGQSNTERAVENLARKKFLWMSHQQFDSLDAILDDRLKYIHSNGWVQTKQEVIADSKSGKLVYEQIDVRQMDVRIYDGAAIVTGRGTFSGKLNNAPFAIDLTFTEVYVHKKKGWLLAARHANKMP
jgi:hypothetical protein